MAQPIASALSHCVHSMASFRSLEASLRACMLLLLQQLTTTTHILGCDELLVTAYLLQNVCTKFH